jgi:hypothetical protein
LKFFKRLVMPSETSHAQVPSLGSGRRLRSKLTLKECIANLEAILLGYRPPMYSQMPPYVFPGWRWNGPQEQSPTTVIFFVDSNNDFLLAAFWADSNGTECGLFPLGGGDERLSAMPIIGHWKQRDSSLTSIGVVPGGQITLAPPRVPDQFFDEILRTAGFPSTPRNIEKIRTKIGDMFLTKAHQFLAADDPASADRFVQSHMYGGNPSREFCQSVLDDLATWNPNLLPYMQDLPMRCRAIVLEAVDYPSGSMWEEYER